MTRRRALTDEQCVELARWYEARRSMADKAAELGISINALYDAIARGQRQPTHNERHKLAEAMAELGLTGSGLGST